RQVLLYPEEGWARSAASSYWTLAPCWWNKSRCKVVEIAGTRRYTTRAKLIESEKGNLYIIGSFHKSVPDPDFKLWLTSSVSPSDQNMGYYMTGSLDRGDRATTSTYQTTHFAVITRPATTATTSKNSTALLSFSVGRQGACGQQQQPSTSST
ncbi:hypothetical protein AAG570_006009, partial [Ranatra chinensis]